MDKDENNTENNKQGEFDYTYKSYGNTTQETDDDVRTKPHVFWDTQPVVKFGETVNVFISLL
jgi:hypothetical protein